MRGRGRPSATNLEVEHLRRLVDAHRSPGSASSHRPQDVPIPRSAGRESKRGRRGSGDVLEIIADSLAEAIDAQSLEHHYQPIVDVDTGEVLGLEALSRWTDARFGVVPPDLFVSIAERFDLVERLDAFGFRHAIAETEAWAAGRPGSFVSINVSCITACRRAFVRSVCEAVRETPSLPTRFVLELTETAKPEDPKCFVESMRTLHDHGVRIALDDFGTRHSSLELLGFAPISHMKIDRAFVAQIGISRRIETVVAHLLELARNLDVAVVAEGIESREQVAWLRAHGCRYAQGFAFSRPLPAARAFEIRRCELVDAHVGSESVTRPP